MPGGWTSIHPDMQAALQSIGVEEDQVLLGWEDNPGESQRSHAPEGEIDGHPFCSTVDLPWALRSEAFRRRLVDVGFAPLCLQWPASAPPHIHAVYVGARDHRGVVTARASTRQLILHFMSDAPNKRLTLAEDAPSPEERAILRARYEAWAPDPWMTVLGPSGEPIDCYPFVEPDRPGVIRCRAGYLAHKLKLGLGITVAAPGKVVVRLGAALEFCLPEVGYRAEDPQDRVDLLPFISFLGLRAETAAGPRGETVVQLLGEVSLRDPQPVEEEPEPRPRRKRAAGGPPPPDDAFTRAYRELVGRLYRPLKPSDGLPEADLVAAEERLGVKLPAALRAVYRVSGAFDKLHQEFHPLILPEGLQVEDGFLPYHDDCQGASEWSLRVADLGQPDPPVYVKPCAEGEQWQLDHPCLSGFLTMMVYLQAVEAGLPHTAVEDVTPATMERVAREWPLVSDGGLPDSGIRIYSAGRQVIVLYPDAPDMQLHAAARTTAEFRDIGRRLGIELDEC